jgi:DNA-binding transcriptional LysR family regulator
MGGSRWSATKPRATRTSRPDLRGIGIAFLPQLAVGREIRRRELLAIHVRDAKPLSRSLDVIHPRQRPLGTEAQALLKALRAAVDETDPAPRRRPRARRR